MKHACDPCPDAPGGRPDRPGPGRRAVCVALASGGLLGGCPDPRPGPGPAAPAAGGGGPASAPPGPGPASAPPEAGPASAPGPASSPAASAAPPASAPRASEPGGTAGVPPIFVLNSLDADVSVIDGQSLQELKRIPVGKEPHHLYLTPDRQTLMVANALGDSITCIDPLRAEVQRELRQIPDPYHLRFSPDMRWFVTLANRLDHVDLYHWEPGEADPLRLVRRIPTGKTPSHQWIDSRSERVYATMQDSDELIAVDLKTQDIAWRVPTGRMPADVYLSADDRTVFVALTGDKVVEVFDVSDGPGRPVARIETGAGAHAFRAIGDRRHLLCSNRAANTLSLIDTETRTVVDRFPGPGGPDCMDLRRDGRTLLLTSRWARRLTVIDLPTRAVVAQVKVGASPHGVFTLDHAPRQ